MATAIKATWWDKLGTTFGFADDPFLTSDGLIRTLQESVAPNMLLLLSADFIALHASVLQGATVSKAAKSEILVAKTGQDDLILGKGGVDYLSGNLGDDIILGGSDKDIIHPGSGIDFVIGNLNGEAVSDGDTVTYLSAISGINVNVSLHTTAPAPLGSIHKFTWDDLLDAVTPKIKNFQTGPGGDALDISDLLQHVGYKGTDAFADGYLRLRAGNGEIRVQFDPDGFGGVGGKNLVRLVGVDAASFSPADNLITSHSDSGTAPSDFSLVSQDGHGSYDVLYSIENIMGSDFNDIIHGRDDAANILFGGIGNDALYGEGGDDIIVGGVGNDSLSGDAGNDLILIDAGSDSAYGGDGIDTFKFTGGFLNDLGQASATIWDFKTGTGGDKLDVSELLTAAGYHGTNPVADGYITITRSSSNTLVGFDADGSAGPESSVLLATLRDVSSKTFSVSQNLVTQAPSILFASVLGQSNASGLSLIAKGDSGIAHLQNGLETQTDFAKVSTLTIDEKNQFLNVAVGGTTVDGNAHTDPDGIWWYPNEGKPGEILIRAIDILAKQIAQLRAEGAVTPILIWGQGETEANSIGTPKSEAGRMAQEQRYMDSTRAVFDYIKEHVGSDIQFYIMQTGRFSTAGALTEGQQQHTIDKINEGLDHLHHAQQQMALAYDDVHLAINYADLPLLQEITPEMDPEYDPEWATDAWHTAFPSRNIMGDRMADFIALDLGQDHVVDNPGPYPRGLLVDLTIHDQPGQAIDGNTNDNIIAGTSNADTIHGHEGNDIIVGGGGADTLYGDAGSDIFYVHPSLLQEMAESPSVPFTDTLADFETGAGGDALDISALLDSIGYTGTDPIADGIVAVRQDGTDTVISFDADGASEAFSATDIARLSLTDSSAFDPLHNLLVVSDLASV